jgi:peptide/nickel transport system ATP-binding protein
MNRQITSEPIAAIRVNALTKKVSDAGGELVILNNISFDVTAGVSMAIAGASGSGKTMLALAVAGLLPREAEVSGSVTLDGIELRELPERDLAQVRGDQIGIVFQEPKSALNPLQTLGKQITESLELHFSLSREQRREAEQRLARKVGFDDPDRLLKSYPHQVSGGQRQRVAIAAAIAASPQLLIADEPTTALDVSVQQGILRLFTQLCKAEEMSLMFITHDIAVLSEMVSEAVVLDAGRVVETGKISQIVNAPQHPVTQQLVAAARAAEEGFFGGARA